MEKDEKERNFTEKFWSKINKKNKFYDPKAAIVSRNVVIK